MITYNLPPFFSANFSALQRAENSSIASRNAVLGSRPDFSALQRAENSSIVVEELGVEFLTRFQCSSASRKFLNAGAASLGAALIEFQCSSASRKFLNVPEHRAYTSDCANFSALQRAENSSI